MNTAIAFQGELGSNSHKACLDVYPEFSVIPCISFEDTFEQVMHAGAALAMIPIENSIAGRVADIHALLPQTSLQIIGEYFLPIRFSLLGIPGSSINQAKEVHSHIHALGQCRKFIRSLRMTPVVAGDTAGSAREVREWNDPTKVSIAPPMAAELHGLEVLASEIEDESTNTTRFIVLADKPPIASEKLPGPIITSFVFRVKNIPSALYKSLGGFATNGVNITRLESYMVGVEFKIAMFIVDVEGHPKDKSVSLAFAELEFFSSEVKILGAYPAHPYRKLNGPDKTVIK